ncbi:hypothetical protein ACNJUT_22300, partial [Mycobacterium tuberculosis]
DGVRTSGQTYFARDRPFHIDRQGYLEEVFFDISYSPVRAGDGGIAGVMCVVNETTDHIRALEHLDLAQEAGGAGVFEWYPDTNAITVSSGYRRLVGMGPDAP